MFILALRDTFIPKVTLIYMVTVHAETHKYIRHLSEFRG